MRIPTRRGDFKGLPLDPHITREKHDELTAQLDRLKKTTRLRVMKEVATLAEGGDFSENAAYQIAKGRLRGINDRIHELEEYLKRVEVIVPKKNGDVDIGSRVTVEVNGKRKTYEILGSSETDPVKGVISYTSPLGSALMGKRAGDRIVVAARGVSFSYMIIDVQ